MGAAYRWRMGLRGGDYSASEVFKTPEELWQWVTDFCRKGERTVVGCHNLGYDSRISGILDLLPSLGWELVWSNLASSVSSMTWRGDRGTLVFTDLFAWLPVPLEEIGELVGQPKMRMPAQSASARLWREYCLNDALIVKLAMQQLAEYVKTNDLGNWQPTGAGMSYAVWRHKFMTHRVLVHDDETALTAERKAMHTGRAEAWRHGELTGDKWFEVDLRQAYTRIAATTELPTKLKYHNGPVTLGQYRALGKRFRVLGLCEVRTAVPSVPSHVGGRTIWPVGEFTTWLWDAEIDLALASAEQVSIRECFVYTRAPILADWAQWVLRMQDVPNEACPPVVRKWIKHSGRTLIGRIALRTSQWEVWGGNPDERVGITHMVDTETGRVQRMMHAGNQTFAETGKREGRDSLPQVTGYIMSACRVWLWEAMCASGLENIAHVDTDSLITNTEGLRRLMVALDERFTELWQVKATYKRMTVYAPRNYRGDAVRKVAGVSKRAVEVAPNQFVGERWASLAGDLGEGISDGVSMFPHTWQMKTKDPRRDDSPGGGTGTVSRVVGQSSNVSS